MKHLATVKPPTQSGGQSCRFVPVLGLVVRSTAPLMSAACLLVGHLFSLESGEHKLYWVSSTKYAVMPCSLNRTAAACLQQSTIQCYSRWRSGPYSAARKLRSMYLPCCFGNGHHEPYRSCRGWCRMASPAAVTLPAVDKRVTVCELLLPK